MAPMPTGLILSDSLPLPLSSIYLLREFIFLAHRSHQWLDILSDSLPLPLSSIYLLREFIFLAQSIPRPKTFAPKKLLLAERNYTPDLKACTFNGTDVTVLERQQARFKWLQQQQPNCVYQTNSVEICSNLVPQFHGLIGHDSTGGNLFQVKTPEFYLGRNDGFPKFSNFSVAKADFGADRKGFMPSETVIDQFISRTSSCKMEGSETVKTKGAEPGVLAEKMESITRTRTDNLIKRKAETVVGGKGKYKRVKGEQEAESEIKAKCGTEISATSPKENFKISEVQKPDYIHVRARRGQATDSHSLAERARREKISKKMKCLQDLVPGCYKVTGKAGMLDEIINYVQSLQRQVEFLSMKLAALNPRLEFNISDFPEKEFPAYMANFPTAAKLSAMANLASCLQFSSLQQGATSCISDLTMHLPPTAPQGNTSISVSMAELALKSSCITVIIPIPDNPILTILMPAATIHFIMDWNHIAATSILGDGFRGSLQWIRYGVSLIVIKCFLLFWPPTSIYRLSNLDCFAQNQLQHLTWDEMLDIIHQRTEHISIIVLMVMFLSFHHRMMSEDTFFVYIFV